MTRHPALVNADLVIELEEERARAERMAWESAEARYWRRWWRNMCLAGSDIAVMEALCRGESVPLESLDPAQVARFGLR